jgi:predicted nucleic acid-binding protein
MISTAIVDSGPLIASVNKADPSHIACVKALISHEYHLVIPAMCVAEAAYLLASEVGSGIEAQFLRGLESFDVQVPILDEWERIADYVEKYADLRLGGTDASIVVLAERHNTDLLITLDRRHFEIVRPKHCKGFRILPEKNW